MDIFGIGYAIKASVSMYLRVSRGTGRTTQMLKSLRDGDCVVFINPKEADRVKKEALRMNLDIKYVIYDFNNHRHTESLYGIGGRVVLDHSLVEKLYEDAIDHVNSHINELQARGCYDGLNVPETEIRRTNEKLFREY